MKKIFSIILINACLITSIMGTEFDFNVLTGQAKEYFLLYHNKSTPSALAYAIKLHFGVSVPKTTEVGLRLSRYVTRISEAYVKKQSALKLLKALDGRGDGDIINAGIRQTGPESGELDPIKSALYTIAASSLKQSEILEEYNRALEIQQGIKDKYHVHMVYYLTLKLREIIGFGDQTQNIETLFKNSWDYKKSEWFKLVQKYYDRFASDAFELAKRRFLEEVRAAGKTLPDDYHVDFDTIEAYRLAKNSKLFQSLVNNPIPMKSDDSGSTEWYNSLEKSDKINTFASAIAIFSSFVREGNEAFWAYVRNENLFLHDFIMDAGVQQNDVQSVINSPEITAPDIPPQGWENWGMDDKLIWVDQQYDIFARAQKLPYQAWPRNQQIYFRTIVSMAKEALENPTTFKPTGGETNNFIPPRSVPQQYQALWLKTQQDFLQRQGWLQAILEVINTYVYAKENSLLSNFYNQITNPSGPCSPARLRTITEWADTQKKFRSFNGLYDFNETSQVTKAYEHIIQTAFLQKSQNNSVELPTLISWLSPFMIHYVALNWRYGMIESPISISKELVNDGTNNILMAKDKHGEFVFDKIFTQQVYQDAIKDLIERSFVEAIAISINDQNIFNLIGHHPPTYRSKLPVFHGHKAKIPNPEFSESRHVLYEDGIRYNLMGRQIIQEFNTLNQLYIQIIMNPDGETVNVIQTIAANRTIFDYIMYALTSNMEKSLDEVRQQLRERGVKSKVVS